MGDRRLAVLAVAVVALVAFSGCRGDGASADASSEVTDARGDVRQGPKSDTPQPPGIDLASAQLAVDDEGLSFTATSADEGGAAKRLWVLRLRDTKGALLYMLYAGDLGDGTRDVLLCEDDQMCFDRAAGATVQETGTSAHVRVPMARLSKLPDSFVWEASASAVLTPNIDDFWIDYAPKATLNR